MADIWNNQIFRYVVRDSWNRANGIASTAGGGLIFLAVSFFQSLTGAEFSHEELIRSFEYAVIGFLALWFLILLFRLLWWPYHNRLQLHGGLTSFLKVRLGAFMWPVILVAAGVVLLLAGIIWLSFLTIDGASPKQHTETPNTVGNPDFSLLAPRGRYRFTWPTGNLMSFYLRLDTEKNPDISNNPAFILRNHTNTVAYRVLATWKSETSMNVEDEVRYSPKLSQAKFIVNETSLQVISTDGKKPRGNFVYYLSDAPQQTIAVIAKEEEIYFPIQIWPLAAIYLVAKTPDNIGETSPPFVTRLTLNWETSEGKRQRAYRVKITATNAKGSAIDMPLIDAFLNFSLEEIPQ